MRENVLNTNYQNDKCNGQKHKAFSRYITCKNHEKPEPAFIRYSETSWA